MKKGIILLLFCSVLSGAGLAVSAPSNPRIALVLSGGIVTRGLSEIGVIKALEEEHIPISYVAGTSMGSVLGSLLAQGYSADEIRSVAKSIDWMQAFIQSADYKNLLFGEKEKYGKYLVRMELEGFKPVIPRSLVNEQRPALLFTEISLRALNISDFNKFKIPFRTNATDLETGQEVVFSSGYLPKVLQASSAVPMMMAPVEIDGKLLVDGGAVDNLPVGLVKEFKPDVIIAVNLGTDLKKKEDLNSLLTILSQNLSFLQRESAERNKKSADILIEPDISKYSFSDFGKIDEIIEIGYQAARAKMPQIKKLLAKKGWKAIPEMQVEATRPIKDVYINGGTIYTGDVLAALISSEAGKLFDPAVMERDRRAIWNKYFFDGYKLAEVSASFESAAGKLSFNISEGRIEAVRFVGRENLSDVFLKDKVKIRGLFNTQKVEDDIGRLYSSGYFETVGFRLVSGQSGGFVLEYLLKEKYRNSLAIGLHYDTYQQLSLLSDLDLNYSKHQNFRQTVSIRLGNEYNLQLISEFWPQRFGQNLLGEATLFYFNKSQDLYNGSQLDSTFHYLTRGGRLGLKINMEPLGRIAAGLEYADVSYEKIFSLLPAEKITRLYLRTKFDFLDEPIFPKSGALINLEYLEGLRALAGEYEFTKTRIDLEGYIPLPWKHVIFAKGKMYLGQGNIPFSERYRLGGEANLVGFGRDQFIGKDLMSLRLGYRFTLASPAAGLVEGVYLSLIQDLGVTAQSFNELKTNQVNAGYGAEFQFNTILGLASRLSIGLGQKTALFLAVGNEF